MCCGSPAGLSQSSPVRGQNYRAWNDHTHSATLGWTLLCQRCSHPFCSGLSGLDYSPGGGFQRLLFKVKLELLVLYACYMPSTKHVLCQDYTRSCEKGLPLAASWPITYWPSFHRSETSSGAMVWE